MTGLIVVNVILLVAVGALAIFLVQGQRRTAQANAALRELLLARASGKLTDEEFSQRQVALLDPSAGPSLRYAWIAVPVIVIASAAGYWMMSSKAPTAGSVPTLSMSPPSFPLTGKSKTGEAKMPEAAQANSGGDLHVMAKRLADKMAKDPKNGDGWLLLARTYGELRQPKEAADAYAKAAALLPPDATLLADWADAHVMANDRKWDEEARKIVQRALAADPKQVKALALAGSEAYERGDYKAAIGYWKRMGATAAPGSMDAKLAEANIQEAEARMSGKAPLDRIMDAAPPKK